MDVRMDVRTYGRTDGRTDGLTDSHQLEFMRLIESEISLCAERGAVDHEYGRTEHGGKCCVLLCCCCCDCRSRRSAGCAEEVEQQQQQQEEEEEEEELRQKLREAGRCGCRARARLWGERARSWTLYHFLPYDKTTWGKLRDWRWWVLMSLRAVPTSQALCFGALLLLIDKSDDYQLLHFTQRWVGG